MARKDEALRDAEESLGRFTSDEGSTQKDFDTADHVHHALALKASDVKAPASISKMETVDYVLVPREPTKHILTVSHNHFDDMSITIDAEQIKVVYKAMITAYEQGKV